MDTNGPKKHVFLKRGGRTGSQRLKNPTPAKQLMKATGKQEIEQKPNRYPQGGMFKQIR